MKVSILGTGRMGKGLVNNLLPHLEELRWGSRSVQRLTELIQGHAYRSKIVPVDYVEALEADVIIHAFWFRDVLPWARANRDKLSGKIMVDIANPFTEDFNDFVTDWGTSAAEELQKLLPDTKVVGAFKNTFFKVLEEPLHQGLRSDVYVTGNDEEAKRTVMELIEPAPFRVWDGGRLCNNRTIERMTLFEREVAVRYGNYPYVSFRMFGMNE
ncbi:NADPH-dependent F420 reductase [Paenibacillus allorhizosphaerae]|uniref:Pyrroline-5-carboxylate reductase catalytic N-terminal domain-containing protein n=1 Tax=Paenibacillus allorhizosphaerae TaxID=2849866 RepID=A0ABM8VHU8_9BACL|nr:NAD(P)-binding domain-containing protein [Paenibacillus allorhizosphaerae]CAG7642779.1 hypothetical protein PAECIP111802_02902 [Paenibacillus allorhizosphaerae]